MQFNRSIIWVLYDLPVDTQNERGIASKFRKYLLKNGYTCFQKSVYIKLLRGKFSVKSEVNELKRNAPNKGNINALVTSLNDFKELHNILGEKFNFSLFLDDFLII